MTEQPGNALVSAPDVGLYVDNDRAIAAVSHPVAAGPSLHIASLHAAVLNTHPDGTVSLGDVTGPHSEAFTDFMDSPDGASVAGSKGTVYPAEKLASMALLCLLTEVASSMVRAPGDVAAAATYPQRWTAEQVSALRSSMNMHGLAHVALVSESEANRAWSASVQATWVSTDTAIAAARGAAILAAQFPVDAITEQFSAVPAATASGRTSRRPLFVAAAFAAALTVGAALFALQLGDSSVTTVPSIEDAKLAVPPTTTAPAPLGPIDFPTAVAEPAAAVVPQIPLAPITTEPSTTQPTAERTARPTTEIATRPVAELPRTVATTVKPTTTTAPTEDETDEETTPEPPVTTEPSDPPAALLVPNQQGAETIR